MYIEIVTLRNDDSGQGLYDVQTYRRIKNLTFAPDADVTATSLPVQGFEADIITTDDLHDADWATLYDDMDQLWADYDLTYAERVDENTVHIRAQSVLYRLQYKEMEEAMYEGETAAEVVRRCFEDVTLRYELNEDLRDVPVTGYCPAQTARERLTWLCFVLGAYVDSVYRDTAQIKPVDDTEALIPLEHTFWRPTVGYDDWVTAVKVTAYTFRRGTEDELATSSTYKFPLPWIADEQTFTLTNPDAPSNAPENVKEVDELYIVNPQNADGILSRLAKYWFKRQTVELDCINNRAYAPGDLVTAYTDPQTLIRGYIQSATFQFGVQARSTLKLVGVDNRDGGQVIVNYLYNGLQLGRAAYTLPVGYGFSLQNPYLDKTHNGHHYIYRPMSPTAQGVVGPASVTVDVDYEIALDLHKNVLTVLSVDDIELKTIGDNEVGVIK